MNCFLFDAGPRRRTWPKELGVGVGDDVAAAADPASPAAKFDARLPAGWGVATTKKAILRRHPTLKAAWGRRLGMVLMLAESNILIEVLKELISLGVPALALHDGLLVAGSHREQAQRVMMEKARSAVGFTIPVAVKELEDAVS